MSTLLILLFLSWFAGLNMGLTWYAGAIVRIYRFARRHVSRREPVVRQRVRA